MMSAAMTAKSGASLACATWPLLQRRARPRPQRSARPHPLHAPRAGRGHRCPILLTCSGAAAPHPLPRAGASWPLAAGLVMLQIGLGALVILLEVPIWKAVLHQAVGVLTFAIVTPDPVAGAAACGRAWHRAWRAAMGWHYAALEERFRRIAGVNGALAILDWDTAVMMPRKAAADRGEQLAALKRISPRAPDPRRDRRAAGRRRGRGRPRPLAAGQPARDAPQVPPRPRAGAGPGRGAGARHHQPAR